MLWKCVNGLCPPWSPYETYMYDVEMCEWPVPTLVSMAFSRRMTRSSTSHEDLTLSRGTTKLRMQFSSSPANSSPPHPRGSTSREERRRRTRREDLLPIMRVTLEVLVHGSFVDAIVFVARAAQMYTPLFDECFLEVNLTPKLPLVRFC